MTRLRRRSPVLQAAFLTAIVFLAVGAALNWRSRDQIRTREATIARARALAERGLFARASRLLEPYSEALIKTSEGCQLLISAYYNARLIEKCSRIAQKCATRGYGTTEGVLGSAEIYELRGQTARAIALLKEGFKHHEKDERLARALARALSKADQKDEASAVYLAAALVIPRERTGFSYEAMSFFSELSLSNEVRLMAGRLKPEDFPDLERRLDTARALLRSGARAEAGVWIADIRAALEKDPEPGKFLSARFPDVLGSNQGSPR